MEKKNLFPSTLEKEVVEVCQQLIRIRSVNPPGDEMGAAEYVAAELEKAGLAVEMVKHSAKRASVLVRLKSSRQISPLLFNGHLDTVPVGDEPWDHEPFSGIVAGGKIWGRGASDMKGGLAAMMVGVKTLAEAGESLKGDLLLAATASEETDSLGAMTLASRSDLGPVQAVIISEPSSNDIFIAEKGALWLEFRTHGKTAHGSMPEQGRNAVMMMVRLIGELGNWSIPSERHPLLGGFTRSMNTIAGGVKTNVVPDSCVMTMDLRTLPGQGHQAIVKQIEGLLADLGRKDPDLNASVRIINDRLPVETSPAEPAVQKFIEVVAEITGQRPEPKGAPYYSDAVAFVPALQAPMIICGPGEAKLAHQPNEHVDIAKLVQSAQIFNRAAKAFLQ